MSDISQTLREQPLSQALLAAFSGIFGDRLALGEAIRIQHGSSESHFKPILPDAVVFPRSTQEVVELVKQCVTAKVPMIPFGAGTSMEGHTLPVRGGVSIDFTQMCRAVTNPATGAPA